MREGMGLGTSKEEGSSDLSVAESLESGGTAQKDFSIGKASSHIGKEGSLGEGGDTKGLLR